MKALRALLIPALAAAGLAMTAQVQAQTTNHRSGGWSGGSHQWSGSHRWAGHYPRYGYGGRVGIYIGAPLLWWGWPYYPYYYDPYFYPRSYVYREVEPYPYPQSYPEGEMVPAPTTELPRSPGAPTQGPLYLNYCESAKAYFPKVTSCPEGWRMIPGN